MLSRHVECRCRLDMSTRQLIRVCFVEIGSDLYLDFAADCDSDSDDWLCLLLVLTAHLCCECLILEELLHSDFVRLDTVLSRCGAARFLSQFTHLSA